MVRKTEVAGIVLCDMTHGPLVIALAALAIIAVAWSPIAAVVIVVLVLVGYGLCKLIGEGGERFFTGSGHR
jgi:hypothetical protein